jgi:hypothetical protein
MGELLRMGTLRRERLRSRARDVMVEKHIERKVDRRRVRKKERYRARVVMVEGYKGRQK